MDTGRRLFSLRRVGDRPVHVAAGLSEGFILSGWYRFVLPLAAVLGPLMIAVVYVSWVALQKSRREDRMRANLRNLCVDAKDAMAQGGAVRIAARNEGRDTARAQRVRIDVIDTGAGIPADVLGKVFEPFFSTRGMGSGTGLGLSQVLGFCLQTGGSVSIRSEPGQGTAVLLVLPAAASAVTELRRSAPSGNPRLKGRVLLVEDNEDMARAIEALLRVSRARVQRVASGDDALALIQAGGERFDAVLSDIAMPGWRCSPSRRIPTSRSPGWRRCRGRRHRPERRG